MRNIIAGIALLVSAGAAMCQSTTTNWTLHAVVDHKQDLRPVVGVLYETPAVGTLMNGKNEKVVTRLELICVPRNPALVPIVAIFWDRLSGNIPQMVEIKVDGRLVEKSRWIPDGSLLIKPINESAQLLQAMKTGRNISVDWEGNDGVRRVSAFDLRDFRSGLPEFNKQCNL